MSTKTKGRAGGHQATPKTTCKCDFAYIVTRVKAAIMTPVWGWFSARQYERVNYMGGPRNE